DVAITIVRISSQLLLVLPGHEPLLGEDGDFGYHRVVGLAERRAGGDPAADQLVFVGAAVHAPAAALAHAAAGLDQEQAALRGRREQAPAACLLDQGVVIEVGLKTEQRQLEAVLAAGLAVAAARVATQLGEDWHDLVGEVDRQILIEGFG